MYNYNEYYKNKTDENALIWCEDHGDLAYFAGTDDTSCAPGFFDPGDLVQFEMSERDRMRRVHNPRLVAEDRYPTLASTLQTAAAATAATPVPHVMATDRTAAIVVRFPRSATGTDAIRKASGGRSFN